ncbi:MAG: hydrogenase nickel incorporation protein HypB [Gemmatimonadetes bacterium]|nr:hydrogenase nickel incorporation protein HypB [Gemmatimonadota bacterium]
MKTIQVIENVQRANDEVAAANRARLEGHGLAAVNLMGGPGSGKTTLLEATVAGLGEDAVVGILTGDLATTRDAERLARLTPHVAQINTGRGCHLEAHQVRHGLDALALDALDLLFIENVGNLICPVSWDLGQERRVALFSMTDGDDKPAKHPYIVLAADLVLLNKIDLAPHVPFDRERFLDDVRHLDEDVPVLELSALTGEGMEAWIEWLTRSATLAAPPAGTGP